MRGKRQLYVVFYLGCKKDPSLRSDTIGSQPIF